MLRTGMRTLLQRRRGPDSHRRALRRKEVLQSAVGVDGENDAERLSHHDGPGNGMGSHLAHVNPTAAQVSSSMPVSAAPGVFLTAASKTTETHQQRNLADAIRLAGTWEEALATFGRATDVAPSARTFQVLSRSLVQHHAHRVTSGGQRLADMLRDASEGSDRWLLSDTERYDMARYVLSEDLQRHRTADVFVDVRHKSIQEGPDNGVVALLEASMRRHGVAPPMDVLADLMCLRISWAAALRLLRFGREAHSGVLPLGEMYERAASLATAPGKTSFGSRPWKLGLALYHEQREAGLTVTSRAHTSALHALWRSCERSWLAPRGTISKQHASFVWSTALRVLHNLQDDQIPLRGEDGCRLYEAAIQTLAHASHWSAAVSLLTRLELSASDVSSSMRVPTSAAIAEAMSGCMRSGNVAYAETLAQLFLSYGYRWRLLPPETLRTLLSVSREAVRLGSTSVARMVVEDVTAASAAKDDAAHRPLLLDRRVALECLNVVSAVQLPMAPDVRWTTALRLVASYDANYWPTQPLERKLELVALFRSVRRIAAACSAGEHNNGSPHVIEASTAAWLRGVFGVRSKEWEWWADSLAHRAGTPMPWRTAMALLEDLVGRRGPQHVPYLPFPLRQLHHLLALSMWRSMDSRANHHRGAGRRAALDVDDGAEDDNGSVPLLNEAVSAAAAAAASEKLTHAVADTEHTLAAIDAMCAGGDMVMPSMVMGCLCMRIAAMLQSGGSTAHHGVVKQWSTAALAALGVAPRSLLYMPSGIVADATVALGMPAEQVEALFTDMHHALRRIALNLAASGRGPKANEEGGGAVAGTLQCDGDGASTSLEAHCW